MQLHWINANSVGFLLIRLSSTVSTRPQFKSQNNNNKIYLFSSGSWFFLFQGQKWFSMTLLMQICATFKTYPTRVSVMLLLHTSISILFTPKRSKFIFQYPCKCKIRDCVQLGLRSVRTVGDILRQIRTCFDTTLSERHKPTWDKWIHQQRKNICRFEALNAKQTVQLPLDPKLLHPIFIENGR